MPEHLRLRRVATRSPLARVAILPSGPGKTVGPQIAYFEAQCPCLHMHLSTLQVRPRGRPRVTRVQDGWLFLFLATLSFATPCRFIPTLSARLGSPWRAQTSPPSQTPPCGFPAAGSSNATHCFKPGVQIRGSNRGYWPSRAWYFAHVSRDPRVRRLSHLCQSLQVPR